MDPIAVETTEEPKKTEKSSLQNQDSPENSIDETAKPQQTSLSYQDSADDLPSSDNFSDIFGDYFSSSTSTSDPSQSSTKPVDLLFSLDEDSEDSSPLTWNLKEDNLALNNLEKIAEDQGVSASSSLFDDLLDVSTPRTSEIDRILQDNMTDLKHVPNVDLLFGVDDDLDSSLGIHSDIKTKTPDILDFVDVPQDLSEVSGVDITESLICEPVTDGWNLVSEVSSSKEQTPDVVLDLDEADGKITKKEQEEEKTDENAKEKIDENIKDELVEKACMEESNNKTDNSKDLGQEIDFSVLELPETSHLNFDHFKHKRNISQKGSIANRKRPKRATLQPNSEDSIFLDSTEPKPNKTETEDEPELALSPNDSKGDNTQKIDSEASKEASPSKQFAGSIKIPGLLEGLNKSKVFNKAERKSPVTESEKVPQVSNADSVSVIDQASKASSSPVLTSSPPVIHPKPVALPRVLPKPSTKTLKDTQNQTVAGGGVARASSFRNKSSDSVVSEQFSLLKSQTALSRSASVKVTSTSAVELSLFGEKKTSPFGHSKLLPPKPELKPLSPPASKPLNKTPPPVPAKPSVPAKPGRSSLGLSASFSGGKSPLLSTLKSETKTDGTSIAEVKSNSILTMNVEKKTESSSIVSTRPKPTVNDKPVSSSFSNDKKTLFFAQKNVEVPSGSQKNVEVPSGGQKNVEVLSSPSMPERIDIVETVDSSSRDFESPKNATVTRLPSLKKPLYSGFVARTGFKGYTKLEGKKTENSDVDDVFDNSDGTADKTSNSISIQNSSNSGEKPESANAVDENSQRRKSSFSGITPVKSPLSSDKPTSSALPRKNSITGSAYNPIGFRSTLGSSDSEQRSRGSSFSSTAEVASTSASVNFLPPAAASSLEISEDTFGSSRGQKSKEELNSSASEQVRNSPEKSLASSPGKTEAESGTLQETKYTPVFTPKGADEKRKEAANATNTDIKEQIKTLKGSNSPSSINGSPDVTRAGIASDKKPPWNIQLKKVEKKETLPKPEPASKTNDSPVNWRQQLSVRQRNTVPPKDSEKPERDNTPEWAKASIKRRQRLIESGVIRGDS